MVNDMTQIEISKLNKKIIDAYKITPIISSGIGVRIDKLWREFSKICPKIEFSEFEKTLLDMIHTYIDGKVGFLLEPQEGMSSEKQSFIHDKGKTGKYFHYIKFNKRLLQGDE